MAEGLKAAFKQAAAAAFNAAGNVKESVTIRSKQQDNTAFNPTTNTVTDPYDIYENIDMILTNYMQQEVDGDSILTTDLKAMCLVDDLDFIPKMQDVVVREEVHNDGSYSYVVWEIIFVKKDAADAVWTFQLRRPS